MPQYIKHRNHNIAFLKCKTFKNERGVPVICKDGLIEVTARGDRDTTSIYAYNDNGDIVGKVNVMSYDKVTRKVCLVPVGIEKSEIKASEIKQGLDDKFAKLMVDFEVTVADRIDITYAKGDKFVHGGSGVIGVYNDDQKSAISKLKETITIDDETCYLFMVKNCMAKKADDSDDVVSGYMPRGYQFGFIYNELTNSRTIAHELSHGAYHLKHTFAADDDYIAPERSTDNLMDYAGGETLNHWQWQDVHLPKSVRFKWLQDEGGAESASITNDQEIIDDIIEKLRCAKASGRSLVHIGSYKVNLSAMSKTLGFSIQCNLGSKYQKYNVYEVKFPYVKESYNDTYYKYTFGEIYMLVGKMHFNDFETYINKTSFVPQVYDIRTALNASDVKTALKVLYRSSYCVFEQLTNNERKQLIKGLSEQLTLPECDENMVLNLLRASAETPEDANDILTYIFSSQSKIFMSLDGGMDDFNGYASHSELIKLLIDLYVKAYNEDIERKFQVSSSLFAMKTEYRYTAIWEKELKGSDIKLSNGKYGINCKLYTLDKEYEFWRLENKGYMELNPLNMIIVSFDRDVSGFKTGDVVAMPMFYYAYLLNVNLDEYKAEVFDNVMYCVGALTVFTKAVVAIQNGAKFGAIVKCFANADLIVATIDKLITANEDVFKTCFESEDEYKSFKESWMFIMDTYTIISSLTSISSNNQKISSKLKDENIDGKVGLLLDGLGIINTYMTKSTQFTQEEIYQIETLRKHLKTWNDDVVY